jgi:hypothetical protein
MFEALVLDRSDEESRATVQTLEIVDLQRLDGRPGLLVRTVKDKCLKH